MSPAKRSFCFLLQNRASRPFSRTENEGMLAVSPLNTELRDISRASICQSKGSCLLFQNRLTRAQPMLTRRQHPRQSSNKPKAEVFFSAFNFELSRLSNCYCNQDQLWVDASLQAHTKRLRASSHDLPTRCPHFSVCTSSERTRCDVLGQRHAIGMLLQRHPFSEPLTWTGGLLHIP